MEDVGIFFYHLAYFTAIWYIFPRFDMLNQEKSGNPVLDRCESNLPNHHKATWPKKRKK
jgi:hypothetical protein